MSLLPFIKSEILLPLGEGAIPAVTHQYGNPKPTFLNVHDDEDTSVAAGLENIRQHGGRLIELAHSHQRLITFSLRGREYRFDLNRIFSQLGIRATLEKHSTYSEEAAREIHQFAVNYLAQFELEKEPVIIALHNTVDGTFSIESFLPGAEYCADASAVHVSQSKDKFDFFYVTEREHFEHLRSRNFNVTLQSPEVTEDGSLSVYFARKGIPYLNIEANIAHLREQIVMVQAAREMVGIMQ